MSPIVLTAIGGDIVDVVRLEDGPDPTAGRGRPAPPSSANEP
jgi:hypothetical protein